MHVKAKYDLICNDTFFAQMFFNLVGDLVGMSMQGFQLIFDRNPQLDWGLGKHETDIFFKLFFLSACMSVYLWYCSKPLKKRLMSSPVGGAKSPQLRFIILPHEFCPLEGRNYVLLLISSFLATSSFLIRSLLHLYLWPLPISFQFIWCQPHLRTKNNPLFIPNYPPTVHKKSPFTLFKNLFHFW